VKGTDGYPHMPILRPPPRAYSSDFRLLWEQNSPKWEIPCPGRRWTSVQNLTPL